jgi:hypothetical protein
MTKLAAGSRSLALPSTTLGVGAPALNMTRRLARVRNRLTSKALFRFDVQLAGYAQAADPDPWRADAPLSDRVLRDARDFLRQLPSTLPAPSVARDDDGSLAFEWSGSPTRHLKVRFADDGMLVYSARLGGRQRVNGAEPLGESLPPLILHAIERVTVC